jgi:DNA polymerase lambda
MGDFLKNCNIHIIPYGLGPKRISLFETQIKKYGGAVTDQLNNKTFATLTHITVEEDSASLAANDIAKQFENTANVKLVKTEWLRDCIKTKSKVEEKPYQVYISTSGVTRAPKRKSEEPSTSSEPETKKSPRAAVNVHELAPKHASGTPTKKGKSKKSEESETKKSPRSDGNVKKLAYAHASPTKSDAGNLNEKIITELKKLADAYKNRGDTWRNFAYMKAVNAIKGHNKEITSFEDARVIPGVGNKIAAKIQELLETGVMKKTQEVCEGEEAKALELFTGIWGAGATAARNWYKLGYRTLEDLEEKATMTNQQKIGLKYYHDINSKIPREEVTEIVKIVECEAHAMYPDLEVIACGSYRRGKPTCGDIDIVMFHPTLDITKTLLPALVKKLREIGLITEDLTNVEESASHRKYYGLCRLQGEGHKHRRLDLFVVPWAERGPALLHYTGSAMFNRSMRLVAQNKGMSLTEHALFSVAIRDGKEKVATGPPLYTPTEEDVFKHLELPYKPPEDRD